MAKTRPCFFFVFIGGEIPKLKQENCNHKFEATYKNANKKASAINCKKKQFATEPNYGLA